LGVAVAFHLRPIVHFRATLVAQNPSARCPTSRRGSQLPKPRRPLELFPGLESLRQRTRPAPAPQEATPESLWQQCLQLIRDNVPAQAFKTWFEPLKPLRWENNTLTVQVPSQFFCEWLEEHYYGLLQQVLLRVLGPHARLEYEVVLERGDELQQRAVRLPAFRTPPVQPTLPLSLTPPPPHIPITPINPRFTFENFVCGASNQLAYTAARSVAEQPGQTRFNPLLLYGGVGLGKTHLAQAINNYLLRRNVPLRLIYVSSEYFTTGYITALQQNRAHEFTAFYNSADVLIIDDVQFLAGKEKTQAHFFHIFNTLYQAGKQLVFTSDKSPRRTSSTSSTRSTKRASNWSSRATNPRASSPSWTSAWSPACSGDWLRKSSRRISNCGWQFCAAKAPTKGSNCPKRCSNTSPTPSPEASASWRAASSISWHGQRWTAARSRSSWHSTPLLPSSGKAIPLQPTLHLR